MTRSEQDGVYSFETKLGWCCVGWNRRGIDFFELPGSDRVSTEQRCLEKAAGRSLISKPPKEIVDLAKRVKRHFDGKPDNFEDISIDQKSISTFAKKTYRALRKVAPGSVVTYGELAKTIGKPKSSRAVGRAMATNPMPLIIPCHRVLRGDRSIGNFSAMGGADFKAKMLFTEGVILDKQHELGIKALRKRDPVMRQIIDKIGPYLAFSSPRTDTYNSLIEAIVHQQLSVKAGRTIAGRFKDLTEGPDFPSPKELEKIKDTDLRGVGLSGQKTSYVRDLASKIETGELNLGALPRLCDEEIIDSLTTVRGIGRWTAQMALIFQFRRLDVLPVDDLGFKNAVQKAYKLNTSPTPSDLETIAQKWEPYRSMATWYLWQSLDAGGI